MKPWGDNYLTDATKIYRGLSGNNAHNRMMSQGTRGIAANKSGSFTNILDSFGGSNPGLVRELLNDVNQSTAMASGELGVKATQYADNLSLQEAQHLERVGSTLKELEFRKDEAEKQRKIALTSALIGGGLSLAGGVAGAAIGATRLKDLAELLKTDRSGGLYEQLLQEFLRNQGDAL